MQFIFGSELGIGLFNPEATIRFDKEFEKAGGGVVGNGFASAGRLQKREDDDKRGFRISTDFLQPGNYLMIEVFSREVLTIENFTTKP